jgi:hypothetical protein
MSLKNFLTISLPVAIIVLIISVFNEWETLGGASILYLLGGGIFWKFVKNT